MDDNDEGVPTQDTHRKKIDKAAKHEDFYAILGKYITCLQTADNEDVVVVFLL